jgi:hypothetical protein
LVKEIVYITIKSIETRAPMNRPRQPAHQVLFFMIILWVWNLSQSGWCPENERMECSFILFVVLISVLMMLRIHPGYNAKLIPTQQLAIKVPDTTNLSIKVIVVVGGGSSSIIRNTNATAMQAKRSESTTSLVGLKSIS